MICSTAIKEEWMLQQFSAYQIRRFSSNDCTWLCFLNLLMLIRMSCLICTTLFILHICADNYAHGKHSSAVVIYYNTEYWRQPWMCDLRYNIDITEDLTYLNSTQYWAKNQKICLMLTSTIFFSPSTAPAFLKDIKLQTA